MAVNPFLNPEIVSVNTVLLNRIEVYVDEKLRDGEWLKNQRRGTKEKQYYEIQFSRDDVRTDVTTPTLTYSLNNNEKKFLQARYLEAGWHEVEVSNSDENGERAGIISVKLTHHASMTIIAIVTDHVNRHLSKRNGSVNDFDLTIDVRPNLQPTLSDNERMVLKTYFHGRGWTSVQITTKGMTVGQTARQLEEIRVQLNK